MIMNLHDTSISRRPRTTPIILTSYTINVKKYLNTVDYCTAISTTLRQLTP